MGRLNGLEAITVDANGTLVRLVDPLPKLERALREHCVERTREEIAAAFAAEGEHYRPRSLLGRDEETLQRLHAECAGVFLAELGADIDPVAFAPVYLAALVFEPVPGAVEALERARRAGIPLAVVSNWDARLPEILRRLGVDRLFETIVTSAEAAAAKPDPRIFELALARLRVAPEQVLHVGDDPWDEEGARRAGLRFAHAPIATALAGIG